jgi:hypothetical protein
VTLAGRAERARLARAFADGVPGPGHPCGDDPRLLASELFGSGIRHNKLGCSRRDGDRCGRDARRGRDLARTKVRLASVIVMALRVVTVVGGIGLSFSVLLLLRVIVQILRERDLTLTS